MKIKYIQQGCQIVIFWGFFNFFQLFFTFYHFSSYFHSEYVKSDFRDFWSKTLGPSLLKHIQNELQNAFNKHLKDAYKMFSK